MKAHNIFQITVSTAHAKMSHVKADYDSTAIRITDFKRFWFIMVERCSDCYSKQANHDQKHSIDV